MELVRHPKPPVDVPSIDGLFALVRVGFAQRRKMLRRVLRSVLGDRTDAVLVAAGIDPAARAETLDLATWAALARAVAADGQVGWVEGHAPPWRLFVVPLSLPPRAAPPRFRPG